MKKISYERFYDKVLGGWTGKCAGAILGAPIEGFKRFNQIELTDKLFENNFPNDDLDLQILWLDMALKKGSYLEERDFSEHWKNHVDFPWNEYGIATRNIKLGLHNPDSGSHNNNYWNQSMGSPIRSEIWGMLCPGQPERAATYAKMDSTVDHTGFSVEAEQYLSACAALAFFEDDLFVILDKGLKYIDPNGGCAEMVQRVIAWNKTYDYDTVAGKIKSYYGDADFTSAPQNIAFTVLSLLRSGASFDSLIDALRLGHDSDCIVATAGALLGIMVGYENLPEQWKERVGNEVLVSPEIVGIDCSDTLTGLSELTCKAGVHFTEKINEVTLSDYPADCLYKVDQRKVLINIRALQHPNPIQKSKGELGLTLTNITDKKQEVRIAIDATYFEGVDKTLEILPNSEQEVTIPLVFNKTPFSFQDTAMTYNVAITVDGKPERSFQNGIPSYGNWLLLGPFIEDDETLEPHHEEYPDHGLSGLPSAIYMNHDKVQPKTHFLNVETISELISKDTIFDQAYHATHIHPQEMHMDLSTHFYGKGERTLYLYSEIDTDKERLQWLCIGSTAHVTVWHDNKEVYAHDDIKRKWPTTHFTELKLHKGENKVLIRLDTQIDDFTLEVGLKDKDGKHPHQSQWNTDLQFNVL